MPQRRSRSQTSDASDPFDGAIASGHRTVTEAAVHAFATHTGDYARMHLDHEFGRSGPLGGPIAHGLLSACWALGALSRHPGDPLGLRDPQAWMVGSSVRLSRIVSIGDTLAFRHGVSGDHAFEPKSDERDDLSSTAFEALNQRGEVAASGVVTIARAETALALRPPSGVPEPWPTESWVRPDSPSVFHAEDLVRAGPRGESLGRTLTESDAVGFAREMGELDPRYLNEAFAAGTVLEGRIVPPMLVYCLAFSDFLESLLRVPMPAEGAAGHVGDSWRCFRPSRVGDTIRTRHRPLSCRRSRSRPDQAIVDFGLQVVDQWDEIVQEGRIAMLIPARPGSAGDRAG